MKIEELERELRAERPQADQEFTRRLDDWAAAGFPRDRGLGPRSGRAESMPRRLWDRLSAVPPRRILMPAGAAATLAVVTAVALTAGNENGGGEISVRDRGDRATGAPSSVSAQELSKPSASAEDQSKAVPGGLLDDSVTSGSRIAPIPPPIDGGGGIARGTDRRLIDATAELSLGAEADQVQDVANDVVGVADRHDGVVLDSQVRTDREGARADFTLEIPYAQLDATLTDLSGLADVISRTEAGRDITVSAVRARKDLAGVFEQIRKARTDLIQADTREQRLIIKSRLQSLNASADALRAQLNGVKRKARFATVAVTVTSDAHAASGDDDWTIGDALDDAGHVLEVIGGIALISLAVLAPLALVATLCWLIVTRTRAHNRERTLDA